MNALISKISCMGMVPAVSINEAEDAVPLAHALMKADLEAMLCAGQSAPQAIAQIVKENPDMAVGAANIIGFTQAREAVEAGAKWITTSGLREDVICWCKENDVVVIPGVSTASEIETAISYGLDCVQFFPAETSGGAQALKLFYDAYADMRFLVSGGITADNLHTYLFSAQCAGCNRRLYAASRCTDAQGLGARDTGWHRGGQRHARLRADSFGCQPKFL